jgi:NADPH:quinone reductase-like Zn-dependent oxidoreductase
MNTNQRTSMKAIVMEKYGAVDVIQIRELPKPKIRENEILVEVYAAGVNPIDNKIRQGKMKPLLTFKLPLILGTDIAGVVVETGSKVSKFKKGDEVYASLGTSKMGAYAQYVPVNENDLALKPKNLTFEEASSIPLVGLTSYQALHDVAKLAPGQKVLVKAGSGGIGTFAVQLAKAMGAEVATTTSTENAGWVKQLGADRIIDYKTQKFEKVLNGYDVIFHTVDGEPTERGLNILKPGGHLLSIVGPPDAKFARSVGLNLFLQWGCGLLGWKINRLSGKAGVHYTFIFVTPSGRQLDEIRSLVETGKIKPVIDRIFEMDQAREAFSYVALGRSKGKVVLRIRGE